MIKLSTVLRAFDDMNYGQRLHAMNLLRSQNAAAIALARRHRDAEEFTQFLNAVDEFMPGQSDLIKAVVLD